MKNRESARTLVYFVTSIGILFCPPFCFNATVYVMVVDRFTERLKLSCLTRVMFVMFNRMKENTKMQFKSRQIFR